MDSEDESFVLKYNRYHTDADFVNFCRERPHTSTILKDEQFEFIMDRLEKEAFRVVHIENNCVIVTF